MRVIHRGSVCPASVSLLRHQRRRRQGFAHGKENTKVPAEIDKQIVAQNIFPSMYNIKKIIRNLIRFILLSSERCEARGGG